MDNRINYKEEKYDYYRAFLRANEHFAGYSDKTGGVFELQRKLTSRDEDVLEYVCGNFKLDLGRELSKEPALQKLFRCVVWITMMSHVCILAGMPEIQSLTIRDLYLQQLSITSSDATLYQWQRRAASNFISVLPPLVKYEEEVEEGFRPQIVNATINLTMLHITEALKLSEIANTLGVNADYLSHVFKKEMGMSYTEFVRRQKVEAAKELFNNTDSSILYVSSRLGFASQSYFTKVFKQYAGVLPSEYRAQAEKNRKSQNDGSA